MSAAPWAAEQFADLVGEPSGDRQPDELVVVRLDVGTRRVRMHLDADGGADDLQRGECDLEVDLHVVDRQRVRVDVDIQPRRLLVADRTVDQQQVVTLAERPDTVLTVVEHLERFAVVAERGGGQDRVGVE